MSSKNHLPAEASGLLLLIRSVCSTALQRLAWTVLADAGFSLVLDATKSPSFPKQSLSCSVLPEP